MATETLRAMALGGMRDHIGGGFHRYSVDGDWRVPHFEKMLYDQAQLVLAYLEAAQATGDEFYAAVAEDTLAYVRRDMTRSATAASIPRKMPTAFRPSTPAIRGRTSRKARSTSGRTRKSAALLGDDADIARRRFGIEPDGNAPQDPQGEFTGKNLLYTAQSIEDVAVATAVEAADEVVAALGRDSRPARSTARASAAAAASRRQDPDRVERLDDRRVCPSRARARRTRPCVGGISSAATPRRAFIRQHVVVEATACCAATATATRRSTRYAEDYAYLIWGLLELFQAGGDAAGSSGRSRCRREQDDKFWDDEDGGWFSTTGEDPTVLLRLKEDYDGAEPAASSVSALNALTLAHLTGDEAMREQAERTLARYGPRIGAAGRPIPMMLCALSAWHAGLSQVVIVGARDRAEPLSRNSRATICRLRS